MSSIAKQLLDDCCGKQLDCEATTELPRTDELPVHKPTNTRKCGSCGVSGHYKNNCPSTDCLPKKKTSTWNMTHKEHAVAKYTCWCGKKEMNKCNLDRHKKNHHAGVDEKKS
jgi:hypothetical protein